MQVTTDENKIAQQNLYLGLESSCDETAAAIVAVGSGKNPRILSSVIYDQSDLHQSFGGVVPEIAARAHAARDREAAPLRLPVALAFLAQFRHFVPQFGYLGEQPT